MAQDPWAEFRTGGAPSPAPATAGPPATIPGRPKPIKPPDLPSGWEYGPDGGARPIKGLPPDAVSGMGGEEKTTYRQLSPDEVASRGLDPTKSYQIGSDGKVDVVPGDAATGKDDGASSSLINVIEKLDVIAFDAADNGGLFETGRSGAFVRSLPNFIQAGSAAYDLAGNLKTVDANAAFNALNEMRQNSPTGGALGQITEKELDLLKSSVGNLDPNQSQEQFFANLAGVKKTYLDMLRRLDPAKADELARKPGIQFREDGQPVLVSPGASRDDTPSDPMGVGGGNPPDGGGDDPLGNRSLEGGRQPRDMSGGQGLIELGKQGITLGLADEAAGIGGLISSAFTGEDPTAAYRRERDLARTEVASARENWPVLGTAMEFMGGGAAGRLANAPSTVRSAASTGATFGGIGGFGYGEGPSSTVNALLGAAGGAALGAGIQKGANALSQYAQRAAPDMNVVAAGERQGIPVRQPDARPELRGRYAAMESTQDAGPLIREARAADSTAIESRIADVAGGPVTPDAYATGKTIQTAGQRYIAKTKAQADRLYTKAREAAGDATVTPRNADAALDANIQELKASGENSNSAAIKYLEGLRDDIDRGLNLGSVQNLRTNMRGQISERGLTGTDTERRVGQVLDAMNRDLTEQLPQEASSALRAADSFYKERQTFINGTLKEFMGSRNAPLDAETAAKRLVSMAQGKGKHDKFSAMWQQLEPAEQAEVTGQIAASLGRAQNGNFSPAMFIKSLDPASGVSPRTVRLVFGKEGAEALADLRTLAQAKSSAMDRISPSGKAIAGQASGLKTLLMAALGMGTGGPAGAVAGGFAQRFYQQWGEQRAARMLLNPDFTKWLKNAPNATNPKAIDRYFGKLGGMTSIAVNDNQAFTQALMQAFKQSPGRAAAEQEPDSRREPPQ